LKRTLIHSTEIEVKFSEADPLGIVWHGHFIRYFEDGREAFGAAYGLRYLDFYRGNIVVPIIHIDCDYKRMLRYGHTIRLQTTFVDTPAAKLLFDYTITDVHTGELVATGTSVQVFLQKDNLELMLTLPPFMTEWKERWLRNSPPENKILDL
jgi:acyl-CoA thioester hydrolase